MRDIVTHDSDDFLVNGKILKYLDWRGVGLLKVKTTKALIGLKLLHFH